MMTLTLTLLSPVRCGIGCLLILAAGCGPSTDGPVRYQISGTVTFDDKPVPTGFLSFVPDSEQGNKGPGGGGAIEQGRFKTDAARGTVGGPHVVKIVGYDGVAVTVEGEQLAHGKPLFAPYEMKLDFPKKDGTFEIKVPKEAP